MLRKTATPILLLFFYAINSLQAQEIGITVTDSSFGSPSILGQPRPKGISVKQERVENFHITSTSSDTSVGNSAADINKNRRWEFKLKIPIMNKTRFKLAVGLEYYREEFRFMNPTELTYSEYKSLEDKSLKSAQAVVYMIFPMKNRKYLAIRTGGSLNGDYSTIDLPTMDFFKFSITPVLGWKRSASFTYGIGFNYGYFLGRKSIAPVFVYSRSFNKRWGVDAALPASIKFRRTSNNQKSIHYGIVELNGANYTIRVTDPVLSKFGPISLQKSEIRYLINWEREIYDWVWFSIAGGLRSNLRFRIAEKDKFAVRPLDLILVNRMSDAFIFNVSLFLVPPKKFKR